MGGSHTKLRGQASEIPGNLHNIIPHRLPPGANSIQIRSNRFSFRLPKRQVNLGMGQPLPYHSLASVKEARSELRLQHNKSVCVQLLLCISCSFYLWFGSRYKWMLQLQKFRSYVLQQKNLSVLMCLGMSMQKFCYEVEWLPSLWLRMCW